MVFKVIVAGGRDFKDYSLMKNTLDKILSNKKDLEIVSGTANGADSLGERYARENNLTITPFPAPWNEIEGKPEKEIGVTKQGKKYWKPAGHVRNKQMAEYSDALVAYWNGSNGTGNMIELAKKTNLQVRIIEYGK